MLDRAPKVILMSDPRVAEVSVQDCEELLVDTHSEIAAWLAGPDDGSVRWVRESVRDRLLHAARLLAPTYVLALNEGWRRPALQEAGFEHHLNRLASAYPTRSQRTCADSPVASSLHPTSHHIRPVGPSMLFSSTRTEQPSTWAARWTPIPRTAPDSATPITRMSPSMQETHAPCWATPCVGPVS